MSQPCLVEGFFLLRTSLHILVLERAKSGCIIDIHYVHSGQIFQIAHNAMISGSNMFKPDFPSKPSSFGDIYSEINIDQPVLHLQNHMCHTEICKISGDLPIFSITPSRFLRKTPRHLQLPGLALTMESSMVCNNLDINDNSDNLDTCCWFC